MHPLGLGHNFAYIYESNNIEGKVVNLKQFLSYHFPHVFHSISQTKFYHYLFEFNLWRLNQRMHEAYK